MNNIITLDCTLRDGGYCNNWEFGEKNITQIVQRLVEAKVDYIECGYLTNKYGVTKGQSKFKTINELHKFLPLNQKHNNYLLMMNYGEYNLDELPDSNSSCIAGIRVAFHKKDILEALKTCALIQNKGYKVFVQPMVSLAYTEEEFVEMISLVNKMRPFAFYLVDSFGAMKKKELKRLGEIANSKLEEDIALGFHAHNNLQLAYSNAQFFSEMDIDRKRIVDISVQGMGRGAGNLNAELFLDYLNEYHQGDYRIKPILNIMDEIICRFYDEKPWGYSLPNYLSAIHMIHPNYARYLDEKKTLTLEAMDDIFNSIEYENGVEYNEEFIENKYTDYLSSHGAGKQVFIDALDDLSGKIVLLIAPGRSAETEKDKILSFINTESPVTVSVNHDYPHYKTDYIFVSNLRRFRELSPESYERVITTSNIDTSGIYAHVKYEDLVNDIDMARDNAGLMAIKLLIKSRVSKVYIAGFDGYSLDSYEDYEDKEMTLGKAKDKIGNLNESISKVIKQYSDLIDMCFITSSRLKCSLEKI